MVTRGTSLKEHIRQNVIRQIDLTESLSDAAISRIIDKCILEATEESYIPLKEKIQLKRELFNSFRRLDVITEFLEQDDISEIMVNGQQNIFIEKNGYVIETSKSFESTEKLMSVIQQIVAECDRRINESNPIVDARLKDGSRVNIVMKPVSLNGPVITIRKFPNRIMDINQLCELGAITYEVAVLLKLLVQAKYNIFISGGTGSGKTTFLNALAEFIPKDERIITIEDSAELKLSAIDNLVRLEARNANVAGEGEITIRDLIKASLRMRPDRIIVGEVRDTAAIDMLQAMSTGHEGSISTGHANSAEDMLSRLETMVLMGMEIPVVAVRKQIAASIDIVIHLSRMRDKSRKVISIDEVVGMENSDIKLNRLYEFVETGRSEQYKKISGKLEKVNELIHTEKLISQGLFDVYREAFVEAEYV